MGTPKADPAPSLRSLLGKTPRPAALAWGLRKKRRSVSRRVRSVIARFVERGVTHQALERRFGEPVLPFKDLDGLMLALVGAAGAGIEPAWHTSDIPTEHAIHGFHGATLLLEEASRTSSVWTDVLGFNEAGNDG